LMEATGVPGGNHWFSAITHITILINNIFFRLISFCVILHLHGICKFTGGAYDPEQEVFDKEPSPVKPVKEPEEPQPVPAPVPAPVPPPVVPASPEQESDSEPVMDDDELHNLLGV
jgi:hypothetical protein